MKETKEKSTFLSKMVKGTVLVVTGFVILPKIIEKVSRATYRTSLKNEEIDFDNMGPEIVKKEEKEGDN